MTSAQFGLFQGPENVKAQDQKITEREGLRKELETLLMRRSLEPQDLRRKILRGFLSLYFEADSEVLIKRPLKRLGGRTLESFCLTDEGYSMARAWMQEFRLHLDEKNELIAPLRFPGEKT
jgi:hypothetical protein